MYLCSNVIKSLRVFQHYAVRIIHVTLAIWRPTITTYIDFLPIRGSWPDSSSKCLHGVAPPKCFWSQPIISYKSILVSLMSRSAFQNNTWNKPALIEISPFSWSFYNIPAYFFTCFALLPLFQSKIRALTIFIMGTMDIVKRERWRSSYNSAIPSVFLCPLI